MQSASLSIDERSKHCLKGYPIILPLFPSPLNFEHIQAPQHIP
jgi:hypothetical protein